jgi:hypothetical protein
MHVPIFGGGRRTPKEIGRRFDGKVDVSGRMVRY